MPLAVGRAHAPTATTSRVDRVRIDGLPLRTRTLRDAMVDELPERERLDVVLVHGLGASSATLHPLARRLALAGTVHLLDLPGFGRVPRPRTDVGVADLARLVTRWAGRTGIEGATWVGHSMGAQVVVEAVATTPAVASHAVLVGPTVDDDARTAAQQLVRLAAGAVFEPVRAQALLARTYAECGPRWYLAVLRHMLEHPVAERVRQVDAPVLVVRGEHDRVAPPGWAARLASAARRGTHVTVPGASHAAMYARPDEVADLVLEHVAR
ncbi:alpha/beta fold hydrolase [Cellulomonas sp. KH9]|uniref:alpha/beta fold hydrolase n=1 Tax=Cellulomonas sp. KH9 TaxID=1855324 RepID=UPI0008E78D9C|nr:alpha/beta fold hydrolase [Cellulomonas sp. KH9]SFK30318.1 Lysophospholipase, alpha-beta hydrolase superfamily [Cellulomonas sp. KH9]